MKRNRGTSSLVGLWLILSAGTTGAAATIRVPADQPTIQMALNAAQSGDTISVDGSGGPYYEAIRVDPARLPVITLRGEPNRPRPLVKADERGQVLLRVDNTVNLPVEVHVEGMDFDGDGRSPYGIRLNTADYSGQEPLSRLYLNDVTIRRCRFGLDVGVRFGAWGCDGQWGAVDWSKMQKSRSVVVVDRCAIVECIEDGANLWRTSGSITHSFIGYNGDEGIHTTDAQGLLVEHNVFLLNHAIGLHLHLGNASVVRNNVIARTMIAPPRPPYPVAGGYGLVVGGMLGPDGLFVHNNLFLASDASGVKINPAEVKYDSLQCEGVPAYTELHGNIFMQNGLGVDDTIPDYDLLFNERGIEGMVLDARFNLFRDAQGISNVELDGTNLISVDPVFVDAPTQADVPDSVGDPTVVVDWAERVVEGFALVDSTSPAVDRGNPDPAYNDAGGLARGTERNDIGIFGGPASDWSVSDR